MLKDIDAAIIVSPTTTHFEIAKKCIEAGKHIFVEKPLTSNSNEAQIINDLASKNKIVGQVGFVERYNQAFISCNRFIKIQNLLSPIDFQILIQEGLMYL